MKQIKQYGIFFFLLVIITSCSNRGKDNNLALEYWSSNNNHEIIFSKKIVDQWNIKYPGKTVKYQPVPEGQSSEEIILAAVVGKTTPDIYSSMIEVGEKTGNMEDILDILAIQLERSYKLKAKIQHFSLYYN